MAPVSTGGLFFTPLSTLTYEILLTRIFSVTIWYHFAFVAVSVALFGMKVASLRPNAPMACSWGVNGATSVCASVLAVAVSMGWGISMAFWAGCFFYLAATLAMGVAVLRGRV